MDTQPAFGFQELYAQLVGGIAKALCERAGETSQQKFARTQAAAHAIMAFLPRDAIEVMLAGHCVMFHELMVDSVGDTLRGVASPALRAARGNIVAMDRAFGNNLTRLEHYQSRRSEGRRDVGNAAVEAVAETEIDDRVRRHRGQAPAGAGPEGQVQAGAVDTRDRDELSGAPVVVAGQGETASSLRAASGADRADPGRDGLSDGDGGAGNGRAGAGGIAVPYYPTARTIAALRANPEAMAALTNGDSEAFARAMGEDLPVEEYLAAAASLLKTSHRPDQGTRPPASGNASARNDAAADGRSPFANGSRP